MSIDDTPVSEINVNELTINDVNFPNKICNALNAAGINKLIELTSFSESKLIEIPRIGPRSQEIIISTLAKYNLSLTNSIEECSEISTNDN